MTRPLNAVLRSNKDRRKWLFNSRQKEMALQLNDRTLLPFKDSIVPFSPYVPHNIPWNNTPNRGCPMSPKTSKPTSKQLNHLFRDLDPLDFLGYCTNRFP